MIEIFYWDNISSQIKAKLLKRAMINLEEIKEYVAFWISEIRRKGDQGLLKYIRKFDNDQFKLKNLKVTAKDIKEAYQKTPQKTVAMIKKQIELSRNFQEKQKQPENWFIENCPGVITGQKITPLESVGLYIPAGTAPLPTVMQILAVAAKTAGVPRIAACFPPTAKNYEILIAGDLAGVDEMYRVGGIAAIAALAYGTPTIKPVLKIAGPGNIYVQAAKLQVSGSVAIDMIAGPSEAVILADETANPAYCAADILARAEHDKNAAGVLITNSQKLAQETKIEVEKQFKKLNRKEIIRDSLKRYCALIVTKTFKEAIDLTNEYSPEHLEIITEDPWSLLPKIKNAGAIFLGKYAPVAAGDYASGTNHVLPTGYFSKIFSPVSIRTFQKESEFQYLTKEGLLNLKPIIETISKIEGLDAHNQSVQIRFK